MNKGNILAIILIIALLAMIGINSYNNRNWEKSDLCISWELYGNSTCDKPTNECSNINSENNAWIQECSCQDNSTQKIICMKKTDVWGYNK